jgi:hypothetical protein
LTTAAFSISLALAEVDYMVAWFLPVLAAAVFITPPAADNVSALLQTHQALTSVEPRCKGEQRSDEITVCARRDAYRFRLPFIGYEKGDPRGETFDEERLRLQHKTTPCQDRGPFLTGCGFVGISVGVKFRDRAVTRRELPK